MSGLRIRLLGEFRCSRDEQPVAGLDQPRLQALLTYLLLRRGKPVTRQQLAFLFWPDSAEGQALNNLRKLIHLLRRSLGDSAATLRLDGSALHWSLDSAIDLDLAVFEAALAEADQAGRLADPEGMLLSLQRAVEAYGGDLLPGCYDDWVLAERERLRQRFTISMEQLIELLQARREYRAAIWQANRLLQHDPLQEETYRRLMLLHTLNHDRAQALRVYQSCVEMLHDEFATEPSASTRAVYQQLLSPAGSATVGEPGAGVKRWRNNLPAHLSSFVGRDRELSIAFDLLRQEGTRLLTFSGSPGSGKTRLALQVAAGMLNDFPDGVFLVDLAPLTDQRLIAQSIAHALGLQDNSGQSALEQLRDYLHDKSTLLLLDNFEHLLAGSATIAALMEAAASLKILVTSRAPLRIAGEKEYSVPPLCIPGVQFAGRLEEISKYDAVALFVARTRDVQPDFGLSEQNAALVAEICARLDGLPLAIELAAPRIRLLSPQMLLGRLQQRLKLLTGGARNLPPRHQTLRATLDWSYNLLDVGHQMLLRRMGVFLGGADLQAIEQVCNPNGDLKLDVLEGIAALVEHSLLKPAAPVLNEPRFTMLETIREYALEQLADRGESLELHARHAAYFTALAERSDAVIRGQARQEVAARLTAEEDNLRAALGWLLGQQSDRAPQALRLAGALVEFWELRGHCSEGLSWLDKALTSSGECAAQQRSAADRAKALIGIGRLFNGYFDVEQTNAHLQESVTLARQSGDARLLAEGLMHLGVFSGDANPATCESLLIESEFWARQSGNLWTIGLVLQCRAVRLLEQGKPQAAVAIAQESMRQLQAAGDRWAAAAPRRTLGLIALAQSDWAAAQAYFEAALEIWDDAPYPPGVHSAIYWLGFTALLRGDYEEAEERLGEAITLARQVLSKREEIESLNRLGEVMRARGDYERATQIYGKCLTLMRDAGDEAGVAGMWHDLAYVALHQGDPRRAALLFHRTLLRLTELNSPWQMVDAIVGVAGVLVRSGRAVQATRLLAAAARTRAELDPNDGAFFPTNRRERQHSSALARAALRDDDFTTAWSAGQTLTLEQATLEAIAAVKAAFVDSADMGIPSA